MGPRSARRAAGAISTAPLRKDGDDGRSTSSDRASEPFDRTQRFIAGSRTGAILVVSRGELE